MLISPFFEPLNSHSTKNHIFFLRTSWKDGLSKKIAVEYDLSCIIEKDDISFSRKYDLTRCTENERWSFLKNARKYDIFFSPSENMVFPKGAATAHDLSCIIWKDDVYPGQYMETWCNTQRKKTGNLILRVEV